MPFIRKSKLVFQIIEAVVDRRGRKHQHFRLYAGSDDLLHQGNIAVILGVLVRVLDQFAAVPEVVGLINDNEVIVAPIQSAKVKPV